MLAIAWFQELFKVVQMTDMFVASTFVRTVTPGTSGTPILFAQSLAHLLHRCKDGGRWTWLEMSNALRCDHSDLKDCNDCIFRFFRTNGAVAEQQKHEMAPRQGFLTSVLYLQALQQVAFIPTAGPSAEQGYWLQFAALVSFFARFSLFPIFPWRRLHGEVNGEMRSPAGLLDPRKEDCDNATEYLWFCNARA